MKIKPNATRPPAAQGTEHAGESTATTPSVDPELVPIRLEDTPKRVYARQHRRARRNLIRNNGGINDQGRCFRALMAARTDGPAHFDISTVREKRRDLTKFLSQHGVTGRNAVTLMDKTGLFEEDAKTGWPRGADRVTTAQAAFDLVEDGGAAAYACLDVVNLNGLNAALGYTGAEKAFGAITRIMRRELERLLPDAVLFRHGGDEFSVVLPGGNAKERLDEALQAVHDEVNTFVAKPFQKVDGTFIDLRTIPHRKHPGNERANGVGVVGVVETVGPDDDINSLFSRADLGVEVEKATRWRLPEVNRDGQAAATQLSGMQSRMAQTEAAFAKHIDGLDDTKGPHQGFPTDGDLRLASIVDAAAHLNVPGPELLDEVARLGGLETDALTGFELPEARQRTVDRARDRVVREGTPAFYIEVDIHNLGGLNNGLSFTGADAVLSGMSRLLRDELSKVDADVCFFRHGGDEFGVVITGDGLSQNQVDDAMARVHQRVDAFVSDAGLMDIPHPKYPGQDDYNGTRLVWGTARVTANPDEVNEDVFNRADARLLQRKQALAMGVE